MQRLFFVDGLADAPVQMKVLRGTPGTFEGVVTIANREATFLKQFSLRTEEKVPTLIIRPTWNRPKPAATQHEPMKVDHARSRACFVCGKSGHVANNCRMKKVFAIPAAREMICYFCRESGHFKRNCPKRLKNNNNSNSQTRGAWSNWSHGLRRRKETEADFRSPTMLTSRRSLLPRLVMVPVRTRRPPAMLTNTGLWLIGFSKACLQVKQSGPGPLVFLLRLHRLCWTLIYQESATTLPKPHPQPIIPGQHPATTTTLVTFYLRTPLILHLTILGIN